MGLAIWDNVMNQVNAQQAAADEAKKRRMDTLTPILQPLQDKLGAMKAPGDVSFDKESFTPDNNVYKVKDYTGALPEYETLRNQTSQQINAQKQASDDAMARRFAAMGNLNSGAYIKSAQISDQQAAESRANAMNQIGFQEAQARRGLQQAEENKAFQSSENLANRNFQGAQSVAARNAQFGNQAKMFNAQQGNQFNQWQFDANSKLAQLDLAFKSADQQAANDAFNAEMAKYQQQHSGGLFGAGGFLGLGL